VVITELEPEPIAPAAPAAPPAAGKHNTCLALKEPAHYEPVEVRAVKLRGLKDALGSCTAALQKQVLKNRAMTAYAKPLRKRAVAALAATICASPPRCAWVTMCSYPRSWRRLDAYCRRLPGHLAIVSDALYHPFSIYSFCFSFLCPLDLCVLRSAVCLSSCVYRCNPCNSLGSDQCND
jgi:cytochrome c553